MREFTISTALVYSAFCNVRCRQELKDADKANIECEQVVWQCAKVKASTKVIRFNTALWCQQFKALLTCKFELHKIGSVTTREQENNKRKGIKST